MVTTVIVYRENFPALMECLFALRDQAYRENRIVVVDNSASGETRSLDAKFPEVQILFPSGNVGFAAGNNIGLAHATTELVATLNPDTVPEPGWLEALVEAARGHPETAAFGSLQLLKENRTVVDGAGDCYHISGAFWRSGHGQALANAHIESREIFSPCAAAALYRKEAIDEVGGFDEDFFCYGEDVDLGFRLRLAGYRCRLVPEAVVLHEGGGSSGGRRSDFSAYHGHRNMVWVYVKNMPGFLFWLFLPLHVLVNLAAVLRLMLRGQGSVAWRAKRDASKKLPAMWKKRSVRHKEIGAIWRAMSKAWK